jgi:putative YpdA family bacillithiol system oxidoreductase
LNDDWITWGAYLLPVAAIALYAWLKVRKEGRNRARLQKVQSEGIAEPATLHPSIAEHLCIGCASCVSACPEGDVLGIIDGKSKLIDSTHCIGHGACKAACPVDAITLVFGTIERGVDIPLLSSSFETSIPGIYIAGELGGMGLIRNAVEQGRQAMEVIAAQQKAKSESLDVVIIGAGPAGFSATLTAQKHGLRYVTVEQESLGGAVFKYPRGKIVMTQPMKLDLIGKIKTRETKKESLLEIWQQAEKQTGIKIHYNEALQSITHQDDGFEVTTSKGVYRTKRVLLSIGRRGTPRKLEVPGEDLPKVVYNLVDAEQYQGQRVLVVGGGDSALEAAISIAEQPGTEVTISYRSEAFSRAKEKNRQRLQALVEQNRITVFFKSTVSKISRDQVTLDCDGGIRDLENDAVIISVGGILPTGLLKSIGIEVETKYGTA